MICLPTAKALLFIALSLQPMGSTTIYATSNSESYVWTLQENGWGVVSKGFPSSDFTRDPDIEASLPSEPVPGYLQAIKHHDWSHDSIMIFDNGDRVEKSGDHAFYIINAGGPNQKIFTIFYLKDN